MERLGLKDRNGNLRGSFHREACCKLFAPIPDDGLVVYTYAELRELLRCAIILNKNCPFDSAYIAAELTWAGFDEQRKLLDGDWRKGKGKSGKPL